MLVLIGILAASLGNAAESNDIGELEDPGTCVCDLTSAACDSFCCCDSDCSDDIIAQWESEDPEKDLCVGERFSGHGFKYCVSDTELFRENRRRGMGESTSHDDQICIEVDNTAGVSDFHELIDGVDSDIIDERLEENVEISDVLSFELFSLGSDYSAGDVIPSRLNGNLQFGGIWPVPSPDAFGYCSDMTPARWMLSKVHRPCIRWISSSDECLTTLNIDTYTRNLEIYNTPAGATLNSTAAVSVIEKLDMDTMEKVSIGTESTTSELLNICTNAVVQVHYKVTSNSDGDRLNTVAAELVVADLDLTSSYNLEQQFSVEFRSDTTFARSGNPGYHIGLPLIMASTDYSIEEGGITGVLPDGSCSSGATESILSPLFRFGEDSVFTCYLELTQNDFQSSCGLGNRELPFFSMQSSLEYVAKFGNINSAEPDDWVVINSDDSFDDSSYDSRDGSCKLPNTLVYDIYYTYAGALSNPQSKIIAANRYFKADTRWKFTRPVATATQKFLNTIVVNFIQYEEEFDYYMTERDTDIRIMPDDILYLFRTSYSLGLVAAIFIFY